MSNATRAMHSEAEDNPLVAGLRARIVKLEAVIAKYVQSDEERNLFFGMVGVAFQNWPHSHPFAPEDAEHLRAWALIEVGFCDSLELPKVAGDDRPAIINLGLFFCDGKRHFRVNNSGTHYILRKPKSMAKGTVKVAEFRDLAEKVYALIYTVTAITPEVYKAQKGKAA